MKNKTKQAAIADLLTTFPMTRKELLDYTKWKSISVQAQARLNGLVLFKANTRPTAYFAMRRDWFDDLRVVRPQRIKEFDR